MEIIQGKKTREIAAEEFEGLVSPYDSIEADIGTGDGRFIYESAKKNPDTFFIGIDSDRNNLVKYSHKIYRKPEKGGLPNVLYVISNVENLPPELHGIADTVWIILPWGSLLQGAVLGKKEVLSGIAQLMAPGAVLKMVINYEIKYEAAEIERLGLPPLSGDYIDAVLSPKYEREGIILTKKHFLGPEETKGIPSSWAKRLAYGRHRDTLFIEAKASKT